MLKQSFKTIFAYTGAIACTFLPSLAMAADSYEEKASGLPQFDISTFPSQIFWLTITFTARFILFNNRVLPDISKIIENRKEHIQDELSTAETLKAEATDMQQKYETQLSTAQADASTAIKKATNDAHRTTERKLGLFQAKADRETKAIFTQVEQSKDKILDEANDIIAEIVIENVFKISGIEIDKAEAMRTVATLSDTQAKAA